MRFFLKFFYKRKVNFLFCIFFFRLRPRKSKSINESPADDVKKSKEEKDKSKEKTKTLEKSAEKKSGKGAGSKKGTVAKIPQPDETVSCFS